MRIRFRHCMDRMNDGGEKDDHVTFRHNITLFILIHQGGAPCYIQDFHKIMPVWLHGQPFFLHI